MFSGILITIGLVLLTLVTCSFFEVFIVSQDERREKEQAEKKKKDSDDPTWRLYE